MTLYGSQVFYIDPDAVNGADDVFIVDVKLFFAKLPPPINIAGIANPYVSIMLCQTTGNNVPDPTTIIADSLSQVALANITASSNASVGTTFTFNSPVPVESGAYYGILISFGTPEFQLWENVQGQDLLGTNTPSQGPSGQYTGAFYHMGSNGSLNSLAGTTLKFAVDIAKFTSNSVEIELTNANYEFINYTDISTVFIGDEAVYQDFGGAANGALSSITFYGAGTISINSTSNTIIGTGTSFTNTLIGFVPNDQIIVTDGTTGNIDILTVSSVPNDNTVITTSTPFFSNSAAHYKKTAVATMYNPDYSNSQMILSNSVANSTCQFVPSGISTFDIIAGGTGYTNTDYLLWIAGGSPTSNAKIITDANGTIIGLNISNGGFGYTASSNTANVSFYAANGAASNGISGNVSAIFGGTIRGILSGSWLTYDSFYDFPISTFTPEVLVKLPDIAVSNIVINFANTTHYVNVSSQFTAVQDVYTTSPFPAVIMSRTNEVNTPTSQLELVGTEYKSSYLFANLTVNASNVMLFTSPYMYEEKLDLMTYYYQINNSDYAETTNNGNCISKAITETISFANGLAENISLNASIYQPLGTTIEVFAKIWNPNDPESFNAQSWTQLQITKGAGLVSSSVDPTDMINVSYSLPAFPPTANNLALITTYPGVVTVNTTAGNTTILTSSNLVSLGTSNIILSGDVIKVYNPTPGFSNGDYFITTVLAANGTAIDVSYIPVGNNSVNGSGFVIDRINPLFFNTAFLDATNAGIASYYDNNLAKFVGFSTMAFKFLFLSNSSVIVPKLGNYTAVAIDA